MTTIEAPPFSEATAQRLAQMWRLVDQAGVTAARQRLDAAMLAYEAAITAEVDVRAAERNAKEALDMASFAAEQDAEVFFESEGAKTWLLNADGARERTVTADGRRAWIANHVRTTMASHPANLAWRVEDQALAGVRNDVAIAAAKLSVAKRSLEAAVAVLEVLALAVPR